MSGLPDGATTVQGYNIVSWRRDGLSYTAVSDLNMAELTEPKDRL